MDFVNPNQLSALELAAAIRTRQISPVEVMDATLAYIDTVNDRVNAVIWRNDDEARVAAKVAADIIVHSDPADLPPFHGVPIPIKDLVPVAGWPLTYGSWAAPDNPSEKSAPIVEAFQRAGFLLTGRTNTPEFGWMSATENIRYGITRNPWNLERTPGGSSGGAAAAVATGMFTVAHGSDGGGSIRMPASCCGLVGLKASRGRVPASVIGLGDSGSAQGVLSRNVADTAAVLDVIAGPDRGAWFNAPKPSRPFFAEVGTDPGRLRIGFIDQDPFGLPMDPECAEAVRQAAATLESLGHFVEPTSLSVPSELLVARSNVFASPMAGVDIDWTKVEPHVRADVEAAQTVDSLTYVRSLQDLQRFSRQLVSRWQSDFDILLTPVMSVMPPRAGDLLLAAHESANAASNALLQDVQKASFLFVFNVTGQPAISLPTHMSTDGLPIGVQLVAGPWDESLLLQVASQLETALPWGHRRPS